MNVLFKSRIIFVFILAACSDPVEETHASLDGVSADASFVDSEIKISLQETDDVTNNKPLPGQFGYPCATNSECDVGYCTETASGKICTKICSSDCPKDFTCAAVSVGSADVVYICLSTFVRLCDPCRAHQDCNANGKVGNLCVGAGNGGSFCGVACDPLRQSADCPNGYTCQFVTDAKTNVSGNQCVPSNNTTCSCSARATQLALSTDCANKNVFGLCVGQRVCKPEGLSNCIGQIPEVESCNKLDDNCDGETDNMDSSQIGGVCKQTNEFGTCVGSIIGCDKGQPICNAKLPVPESCNGKDDDCDGFTDENLCEDGNTCTTDVCNTDGSCKHTKLSGPLCNDGNVCTSVSECAAGVCKGGNTLDCDDNDPCSIDWCDPFTGCSHKPGSEGKCLEDGNDCTQDVCVNGKCTHPKVKDGANCLDEGNVCTNDVCDKGECAHNANSAKCDDGNQCTLNDSCKDKTCSVSLPKVCNDANACTIDSCDPKKGCVFQPGEGSGAPCPDDGNACTDDVCKGSVCAHIPVPGCQ